VAFYDFGGSATCGVLRLSFARLPPRVLLADGEKLNFAAG